MAAIVEFTNTTDDVLEVTVTDASGKSKSVSSLQPGSKVSVAVAASGDGTRGGKQI